MGNVASVEDPGRARRTSHKLSKPRTANLDADGLLSPNVLANPRRRFSTMRTMSLPYGTSPAPSPTSAPSDDPALDGQMELGKSEQTGARPRSRSITRSAAALFRSKSSQASQTRSRQDSMGMLTPSPSARPSRANSMIIGDSESYYVQANLNGWYTAGSRSSVNYDLNSYEAKRLLNLVEEQSHEENSVLSESRFHVAETWKSPGTTQLADNEQAAPAAAAAISRANSDITLYTPMRRRSLMTPGVATRAPDVPPLPKKSRARFSLPSTPARRDSLESMSFDIFPSPSFHTNPESIPRVITPCEEDYRQTGAFKLGSLRIMNASPDGSRSERTIASPNAKGRPLFEGQGSNYFERDRTGSNPLQAAGPIVIESHQIRLQSQTLSIANVSSPQALYPSESSLPGASPRSPIYLPEIHLSPLALEKSEAEAMELQITSKHTAVEDDLFEEDDHHEYSRTEVLDVRMDLSAKSLPPRPRLISEGRNPRDMHRSDSGVVASPIAESSHTLLAKSDSGYSSNVSLRSFSGKPVVPEKDQHAKNESESSVSPPKSTVPDLASETVPTPAAAENKDDTPPPVPRKDSPMCHSRPSQDLTPANLPTSQLRGPASLSIKSKGLLSPTKFKGTEALAPPENSPLSPTSSTTSSSNLSEGSGPRKPGRLERFLSSARKPRAVNAMKSSEKAGSSRPQDTAAKPDDHTTFLPLSLRRLTLRPEPSHATLGTIASVGSAEHQHEEMGSAPVLPNIVATGPENGNESQSHDAGTTLRSMGTSLAQTANIVIPTRKPIVRKPVPIRVSTEKQNGRVNPAQVAGAASKGEMQSLLSVPEQTTNTASRRHRISIQGQDKFELRYTSLDASFGVRENLAPTSLRPFSPPEHLRKAKTPPPVSMRTRNAGGLRVPPPLRAQSTPPGNHRRPSGTIPNLPRKASRENVFSFPPAIDPRARPSLSRNSSRNSVRSYPPAQEFYQTLDIGRMGPSPGPTHRGRPLSIMSSNGEYRKTNWEVQTDHDESSRRSSFDRSRRNSLVSQGSSHGIGLSRPPQLPPNGLHGMPQNLRHRASYDGHGYQPVADTAESFLKDNGPYPSIQKNGQAYVTDPWSGRPMSQQWDQQGRYPPYVPRGHSRNRSVGSHGISAPYRVLHSYNSPAYKHVPIWG
ncbi:hypothetical protein JX266_005957 [Neoarthrinium moseri]|nr:hypothetical protein JX266_005957 [Neoarthrinium moseri]